MYSSASITAGSLTEATATISDADYTNLTSLNYVPTWNGVTLTISISEALTNIANDASRSTAISTINTNINSATTVADLKTVLLTITPYL